MWVDVSGRQLEGFVWVARTRFDDRNLLRFRRILGEGTGQTVHQCSRLPPEFALKLVYPANRLAAFFRRLTIPAWSRILPERDS